MTRVYFTQYDGWWSLSLKEAIEVLTLVKNKEGYDLSKYKRLKQKPKCAAGFSGNYYSQYPDMEVINILDTSPYEAKEIIKEFKEIS